MHSPLRAFCCVLFLALLVAPPLAAGTPDGACEAPAASQSVAADLADLSTPDAELRMGGQCGAGETLHKCDVQDSCTGRHFKDSICCPSGTTGDCLVAMNGLGCVESVDAVCVEG